MNDNWYEFSLNISSELCPLINHYLLELGSTQPIEEAFNPNSSITNIVTTTTIRAYFLCSQEVVEDISTSIKKYIDSLVSIFSSSCGGEVEIREITPDDHDKWKRFFKTLHISDRLVIKPSWDDYIKKRGEIVITIDPGMAFGTGTHESTRLCLSLLDETIRGKESLLDVGTGSGILSIAAAKLGVSRIMAIDIDPLSIKVAQENATINDVSHKIEFTNKDLIDLDQHYNIIVANILSETLIDLKKPILERLDNSGFIILSGILNEQASSVIKAYEKEGIILKKNITEGEWSALLLKNE